MNAIETLISVLCGPEGKCCISGSDDDRRLIDSALAELAQAAQADSVTAPAVHSQTYEMLLKAAGTALEVLQKHRQMKGDWPVGELGRRAAEELQAARDASFNADREDPAQLADSVQEDAAWMPLTPELLTAIESGDLGNRFWIAAHNNNEPQIGVYEWWQGRNPHGFNSDLSRYGASEITHVLPYKPPALPAARQQGEKQ